MFRGQLLGEATLPLFYRVHILAPILIFLILEVFFIARVLQRK